MITPRVGGDADECNCSRAERLVESDSPVQYVTVLYGRGHGRYINADSVSQNTIMSLLR